MTNLIMSGLSILRRLPKASNAVRCVWEPAKWSLLIIVLAGFVTLCPGQRKSRTAPLKIVQLPEPKLKGTLSLEEVLAKRPSVQQFTPQPLSYTHISQLAWAGQGITEEQKRFPAAPPEETAYPMNLYFATRDGLFVYNPREHSLVQTSNIDARVRLAAATSQPEAVAEAACDIVIAGSVRQIPSKQRSKARRYMLLQAGHIAQNIRLQAVSLQLGSIPVAAFNMKEAGRASGLPLNLELFYIICVGHPAKPPTTETGEREIGAPGTPGRRLARAVLIVASENFRDEELFETKLVLDSAGVETVTASTKTGTLKGMLGGIAQAEILVNDIVVDNYDAIVFIGGAGAKEYFDNAVAWDIAREAADKGKILAAICIAPSVLANAGVLNGIRVTSYPSERTRLQRAGAIYTGSPVERDGPVITGAGPQAAGLFGEAIADAILGR